ncbi:MAG: MFS transporter [Burkholderiales bacterium]|jgi:MFS family permease|nr:MFS transporter [Burkholderiales bacterium]
MTRVGVAPSTRFPGWTVAGVAALSLATVWGSAYVFPLLLVPLQRTFGLARGPVSWVFASGVALLLALSPWAGGMVARLGLRRTLACAAAATGAGFGLLAVAPNAGVAMAGYALGVGIGGALAYVPAVSAVAPWFLRRRGLATGLASIGTGAGTIAFPWLFTQVAAVHGWRIGVAAVAAVAVVALAIVAALIDDQPAARGWAPDGVPIAPQPRRGPAGGAGGARPTTWRTVLGWPDVRALWLASGLYGATMFLTFGHLVAAATDAGIGAAPAAGLLTLVGAGNIGGRALFGIVSDRGARVAWLAATMAVMGATPLLWPLAATFTGFAAIAVVFGVSYGGAVALFPAATADLLGARFDARVLGIVYSGCVPSALLAPVVAGLVFDRTGSYAPVAIATGGLGLAGAAVVARLAVRAPAAGVAGPR